jgi:tetratricopeptide (TPR) repeat protein
LSIIIIKSFIRAVLVAALLILSGCVTTVTTTGKVLDLDSLADQAYKENRCDEAIEMYSKLAKKLPKNTKSLLRIGNCHARNRRQDDAIAAYRQALARDPYYSKAWYNLGLIQAQMLGQTMAQMGSYLDPADSTMDGMRTLSQVVLDAFAITIKSEVKGNVDQPQETSAMSDNNLENQAPAANE